VSWLLDKPFCPASECIARTVSAIVAGAARGDAGRTPREARSRCAAE